MIKINCKFLLATFRTYSWCWLLLFIALPGEAKIKVEEINFDAQAILTVNYSGPLGPDPIVTFKENILQVEFREAIIWPKIERNFSVILGDLGKKDISLMGYQFTKDMVRVRVLLPFNVPMERLGTEVEKLEQKIKINFKNLFPLTQTAANVEQYDEAYLKQLLAKDDTQEAVPVAKTTAVEEQHRELHFRGEEKRHLQHGGSAFKAKSEQGESILLQYFIKFALILGAIIAFFYLVVHFFRKGVLSKSHLGFLSGTKLINVISTNYVAPKRSLLLVKVHQQILLLSNSENGIQFLTEIRDVANVLKSGEQMLTGQNFDLALQKSESIENIENRITLKEDIHPDRLLPMEVNDRKNNEIPRDQVKFSEQLKKKIKTLRPMKH